jgi:endo-1,4-beta-xylanase
MLTAGLVFPAFASCACGRSQLLPDEALPSTSDASATAIGPDSAPGAAHVKFVGNLDTRGAILPDFASYWDQFTPENAGKWGAVQPSSPDTYNWTRLDAMYKYCEEHDIVFKEHTFVWGNQQPAWTSGLTASTGPETVKGWMKAFCDRYPKTRLIDVVNEPPPHTSPSYLDAIGGSGRSGWDWIVNAFTWAHEACPNAILILNDFDNAEQTSVAQHIIDIVHVLQKAGAPVHAVGCQTHGASGLTSGTLKGNIDLIAQSTGLPIYITEYDIDLADDDLQRQRYQDHITMFWKNPNIKGITLWGYVLGRTWQQNTGIMQSDGTMRPAMAWLMDFLGRP